jgi:ubiquitin-conjugating enzyme E2 S
MSCLGDQREEPLMTSSHPLQKVHHTPAVTSKSNSASLANSLLHHQNVISICAANTNFKLNSLALGWFATKIFHPNVSSAGEICVNTLKKDWQSSFGIAHILVTVKCLLIYPNPESALDEEAGKLLLENYDDYFSRAKLITSVHATPAVCEPLLSNLCPSDLLTLTMPFLRPVQVRPPEFDTKPVPARSSKLTKAAPQPQPSVESITTPTLNIPSPTITSQDATSTSSTQPLKASPSNTLPTSTSNASLTTDSDKQKDRHPSPLGTADANITGKAATNATSKAVKRTAKDTAGANRKKALKRL